LTIDRNESTLNRKQFSRRFGAAGYFCHRLKTGGRICLQCATTLCSCGAAVGLLVSIFKILKIDSFNLFYHYSRFRMSDSNPIDPAFSVITKGKANFVIWRVAVSRMCFRSGLKSWKCHETIEKSPPHFIRSCSVQENALVTWSHAFNKDPQKHCRDWRSG
jgi:hypothetical protein